MTQSEIAKRTTPVYTLLIPWLGLLGIIASLIVYGLAGKELVVLSYVLSGFGVLLGLSYLIVTIRNRHVRSGCSTGFASVFSVFITIVGVLVILVFRSLPNLRNLPEPYAPNLSISLHNAAQSAGQTASRFLKSGDSGNLIPSGWQASHWTNPKGGFLEFEISWSSNNKGILVTVAPVGKIPPGQDGTPATQQVLTNGMYEFPIDYYEQEGKRSEQNSFDISSPYYFMWNDVIQAIATPFIDYARNHEGALPGKSEGDQLLSRTEKSFPMTVEGKKRNGLEITKYTYHPPSAGVYSIDCDWRHPLMGDSTKSTEGVFTVYFTTEGMLACDPDHSAFWKWLSKIG